MSYCLARLVLLSTLPAAAPPSRPPSRSPKPPLGLVPGAAAPGLLPSNPPRMSPSPPPALPAFMFPGGGNGTGWPMPPGAAA